MSMYVPFLNVEPTWPIGRWRPSDHDTITTLLAERAQLQAENAALRAERDHLARMLNPPATQRTNHG